LQITEVEENINSAADILPMPGIYFYKKILRMIPC